MERYEEAEYPLIGVTKTFNGVSASSRLLVARRGELSVAFTRVCACVLRFECVYTEKKNERRKSHLECLERARMEPEYLI